MRKMSQRTSHSQMISRTWKNMSTLTSRAKGRMKNQTGMYVSIYMYDVYTFVFVYLYMYIDRYASI